VRIEPHTRRVVLGDRDELARGSLTAAGTNWLVPNEDIPRHCTVQIRYSTAPVGASVQILPGNRISVTFDEPQHGVAPGQAVVCYDGDRTLGGGWIESQP
jgi:tRNA-uridine 2-sulfurtransferase